MILNSILRNIGSSIPEYIAIKLLQAYFICLLVFLPIAWIFGIASIIHSIRAIKNSESLIKNVLILLCVLLTTVTTTILAANIWSRFLENAMSV